MRPCWQKPGRKRKKQRCDKCALLFIQSVIHRYRGTVAPGDRPGAFHLGGRWFHLLSTVRVALSKRRGGPECIINRGGSNMGSRSSRWPYIRRLAWDRDRKARAPCHICGQPINYYLEPSSAPDSWEPDHLIPVAKDPDRELDLANVLASHMRCNRARGDGTNGENAIGMRSRIW